MSTSDLREHSDEEIDEKNVSKKNVDEHDGWVNRWGVGECTVTEFLTIFGSLL